MHIWVKQVYNQDANSLPGTEFIAWHGLGGPRCGASDLAASAAARRVIGPVLAAPQWAAPRLIPLPVFSMDFCASSSAISCWGALDSSAVARVRGGDVEFGD
jgi:hypothetical protein